MNLFTDLRTALLAMPAVAAIVGSGATAKVWNGWQRIYATPCIVIDLDGDAEQNDLSGSSAGLLISEVTITCRTDDDDATHALWLAVRAGLRGYRGTFDAILDDTAQSTPAKSDGSTGHWYDRVMSFTVMRTES
jgi:hypothetical protein